MLLNPLGPWFVGLLVLGSVIMIPLSALVSVEIVAMTGWRPTFFSENSRQWLKHRHRIPAHKRSPLKQLLDDHDSRGLAGSFQEVWELRGGGHDLGMLGTGPVRSGPRRQAAKKDTFLYNITESHCVLDVNTSTYSFGVIFFLPSFQPII